MDATELESLIVAVATGTHPRASLVEALRAASVAVLLNRGLEGGTLAPEARPLTLNSPEGYPVLAIFSSVEKSAPWVKHEPAYRHALHTGFAWALGNVPPGFGIALNPGYPWSFLLSPPEVRAMKDQGHRAHSEPSWSA